MPPCVLHEPPIGIPRIVALIAPERGGCCHALISKSYSEKRFVLPSLTSRLHVRRQALRRCFSVTLLSSTSTDQLLRFLLLPLNVCTSRSFLVLQHALRYCPHVN